jgi:3-(3-hydroxy-phenyl)propionate hydroxylase
VLLAGDAAHQMPPFAGQGLCSGTRDAANLAWKLAAVVAGADASLLDCYQPEREPNVRAIIDMAIMMGRTVCIADPAAAAERDRQMLAARAAGQAPDGALAYPPVTAGAIMPGTAGAGEYFPQFATGEEVRFDDRLDEGAWLIAAGPVQIAVPGLEIATIDDGRLGPAAGAVRKWLGAHAAEAVLVRPDRHVFGTGEPVGLVEAWKRLVDPVPVSLKTS